MIGDLTRNWWVLVVEGVLAIVFGLLAFFMPGITLAALVLLFGAYAFVDGIISLVSAVRAQEGSPWWALAIRGVAGIGIGVITILWPGITAVTLLFLIAAWAIITGVLEIVAAIRLRKLISGEWLLALAGIASLAFGILLLVAPGPGALAVVWIIGAYAIIFGVLLIVLGLRLKTHG
ncbi:MAG TPA: HdeD family acid-resistance protein, partial [Longimicrobiales bacterium]|nr:HdeD family acid-resistance protein [Longimicrobiales bacterium]